MCVGVTVSLAPPTALACGYYLWHTGQGVALHYGSFQYRRHANDSKTFHYDLDTLPAQSVWSYSAGIITLAGMYLAQDHLIYKWEQQSGSVTKTTTGSSSNATPDKHNFLPHKAPHQAFRPPGTDGTVGAASPVTIGGGVILLLLCRGGANLCGRLFATLR